ncbi:hypothetical protein BpHYR1_037483 [Brachionus plicatilis]|uniref:Uncharacterized protein n=1 Tax=Brachionus plicatilis TaxID=10195 RepID=A0A3M7Q6R0_BRAPC|nr:hypothetical protein BpHYR1_037483 [Brachionus plicatilis]
MNDRSSDLSKFRYSLKTDYKIKLNINMKRKNKTPQFILSRNVNECFETDESIFFFIITPLFHIKYKKYTLFFYKKRCYHLRSVYKTTHENN